jgi:hypothetical protein
MSDDKIFKRCSGICGEILEVNKSNFKLRTDTNKFRDQCRKCIGKGHIIIENNKQYQYCTGECGLKLEIHENNFGWENKNKKLYCRKCKNCFKNYNLDYSKNNKKQLSIKNSIYYSNNCEKILTQKKEYYQKNKTYLKIINNIYYQKNKKRISKQHNEYNSKPKNKIKKNERAKIWQKNKNKIDVSFKLMRNISRLVNFMLNSQGSSKMGKSCKNYLPFTKKQLEEHIEKQFLEPGNEWMTWNNQGVYNFSTWDDNDKSTWVWNLDHIIPQSRLKYDSMEHPNFKKCWELSNLRPYSGKDNVSEGNRR